MVRRRVPPLWPTHPSSPPPTGQPPPVSIPPPPQGDTTVLDSTQPTHWRVVPPTPFGRLLTHSCQPPGRPRCRHGRPRAAAAPSPPPRNPNAASPVHTPARCCASLAPPLLYSCARRSAARSSSPRPTSGNSRRDHHRQRPAWLLLLLRREPGNHPPHPTRLPPARPCRCPPSPPSSYSGQPTDSGSVKGGLVPIARPPQAHTVGGRGEARTLEGHTSLNNGNTGCGCSGSTHRLSCRGQQLDIWVEQTGAEARRWKDSKQ